LYDSPLKRGDFVVSAQSNDKGVCKFAVTHPQPLFLEGSLKVAAFGSLIYESKVLRDLQIIILGNTNSSCRIQQQSVL